MDGWMTQGLNILYHLKGTGVGTGEGWAGENKWYIFVF